MNEEEVFVVLIMMAMTGVGGYLLGRARAARDYVERFGIELRSRSAPVDEPRSSADMERVRTAIESLGHRFDLMEQRVDFTERLVEATQRKSVTKPAEDWAPPR